MDEGRLRGRRPRQALEEEHERDAAADDADRRQRQPLPPPGGPREAAPTCAPPAADDGEQHDGGDDVLAPSCRRSRSPKALTPVALTNTENPLIAAVARARRMPVRRVVVMTGPSSVLRSLVVGPLPVRGWPSAGAPVAVQAASSGVRRSGIDAASRPARIRRVARSSRSPSPSTSARRPGSPGTPWWCAARTGPARTRPGPAARPVPPHPGTRALPLAGSHLVGGGHGIQHGTAATASSTASTARGTAAATAGDSEAPGSNVPASTPTTVTRPGSRPSTRASSTAAASPKAWVPPRPVRAQAASGSGGRPAPVSSSRSVPGAEPEHGGVDDDDPVVAAPQLDEVGGVLVLDDLDPRVGERRDRPRHVPADRVVTPVGAAQPDDQGRRLRQGARTGHPRSTVRSRKWVAHEMHGS